MLISLKHRFIFIANLKTASSSIELSLRPFCEIAISQTHYGKHSSFAEIENRFPWVFKYIERERFLVFGVIRDPVDFALSIYNSHRKKEFIGYTHYTGDKTFLEFYDSWLQKKSWQFEPQYTRFLDKRRNFSLDYILDYSGLVERWPNFCRVLELPAVDLGHHNVSPRGLERNDLDDAMIDKIYDHFDVDYELLRTSVGFVGTSDPGLRPDVLSPRAPQG